MGEKVTSRMPRVTTPSSMVLLSNGVMSLRGAGWRSPRNRMSIANISQPM